MRVTAVRIENFRGIKQLKLELDETTVLIGENNSGKTAVLDALRLCLRDLGARRRTVFDTLDFHLPDADAEPSSAEPIQIEVSFSEQEMGEWNDQLIGRLNRDGILQVGVDGRNHVLLRVTCKYDSTSRDFTQDWSFLNLARDPLTEVRSQALTRIQQEVPYFYLTALRDAVRHFDASGQFWRPFLKDTQLPVEKKTEIEQKLREVNELVVDSHDSFDQVRTALSQVQDVVPLTSGDVVSIEAVPGRMFDMLAKAQIHLGTMTGAKIPVEKHGEGTQSLAVLMLFSAFLKLSPDQDPIVALEEPEAHLHPAAARALDKDLHREGVRVVEYRQTDVGLLTKIANALGIAWYCVGDDDSQRQKTEAKVKENSGSANYADRLVFPYIDIEIHLLGNGYDGIYAPFMPEQNLAKMEKEPSDPDYWIEYAKNLPKKAKTHAAADVAVEMENRGTAGVSEEIRNILDKVISLAGGE